MEWKFENDRPIYLQIVAQIELQILSGHYQAGERLPSVRDLASQAGVNPNTMQRALQELEVRGLVATQRTAGRTITGDQALLGQLRDGRAAGLVQTFLDDMAQLGYTPDEALHFLQQNMKEEEHGTHFRM